MPKRIKNMSYYTVKCFQLLIFCFLIFCYFATLRLNFMQDKTSSVSTYNLFLKPSSPSQVISNFGYLSFGLLDIKESILPGKEQTKEIDYDPSKIGSSTMNSGALENEIKPQTTIDNDIWKTIIEEETSETKNTLNKFFISNSATNTNEYTGLFEGKNLIMIMIESGSNIMLDEEYYPNIAKLYNEGWHFDNYYSPRNTCSTINNEFSNLTGLYTINNNCTAKEYQNNTYFESIFELFNNAGYTTASFHDYTTRYYPRPTIHANLGSNSYYGVDKLGIKYGTTYGDWPSDEDFIESYLNILDKTDTSKPFMNFLTTVTSHQPYTDNSTYNNLYKNDFPSELPSDVRSYMSKLKVVDNAIGLLIDGLEQRGLLEDTIIVLFADHYPYGIAQEKLTAMYDYDATIDYNAEKVPYIIYNPALNSKSITLYSSHVNTTPTMANLFGLDFDSRLYIGSDVFAEDYESITIFDDGSWKNEEAYYDATTNNIKYYTKKVYSDEEILAINEKVSLKLEMSSLAIKNNYFKYLNKLLESYKQTSLDELDEEEQTTQLDET